MTEPFTDVTLDDPMDGSSPIPPEDDVEPGDGPIPVELDDDPAETDPDGQDEEPSEGTPG